jgi:hypothetical protein
MLPSGGLYLDGNHVVRDSAGRVIADYSAPCPAALTGAASSGNDPRGPYDEFVLAYLDENAYPMWTGIQSSWNVPANKPYISTDQAMYWSTRLIGADNSGLGLQIIEAGVSYGPWPVDLSSQNPGTALIPGAFNAWLKIVDDKVAYYSTPVAVQPGAHVSVDIRLDSLVQPYPGAQPPEIALYDPYTYLQWELVLNVDGVRVLHYFIATPDLGLVTWTAAEPGVMSIWNMPGTGVSTCGQAMPSDGQMAIGPFEFATSPATDPTNFTWGPSSQSIVRYGSLPGTPGLNCPGWDPNTNVLLSPPANATLTWPTTSTQASPPPIVPAVPHGVLVGLALLLVLVGPRSLRKARRS